MMEHERQREIAVAQRLFEGATMQQVCSEFRNTHTGATIGLARAYQLRKLALHLLTYRHSQLYGTPELRAWARDVIAKGK